MDAAIVLILWFVCALVGAIIGSMHGRAVEGFFLSLLFGPLGVLIAAVIPDSDEKRREKEGGPTAETSVPHRPNRNAMGEEDFRWMRRQKDPAFKFLPFSDQRRAYEDYLRSLDDPGADQSAPLTRQEFDLWKKRQTSLYNTKTKPEQDLEYQKYLEDFRARVGLHDTKTVEEVSSDTPILAASPAQRLRELKSLLDEGLITQDEFDAKRSGLMQQL